MYLKISDFFGRGLHNSTRKPLKNVEKTGIVLGELIYKGAARPAARPRSFGGCSCAQHTPPGIALSEGGTYHETNQIVCRPAGILI